MGSEDEGETPFARVPEPISGPYEPQSPYTVEGQINQYGQFARGLGRWPVLRWIIGAIIIVMLGLTIYMPFSN